MRALTIALLIALSKRFRCALLLVPLLGTCVLAQASSRFESTEVHMGTAFRIVFYAKNEGTARNAMRAAFAEVTRLDAIMSDYNQASELNRLCHLRAGKPMKLSPDLFRILRLSQKVAAETNGAFDMTVGAVVRLWRRARRTGEMPAKDKLAEALALTGYHNLHLDAKTRTGWLERDGVLLDLGGIAKGYAADAAIAVLKRFGVRSALVAAGGDIVVSNAPPGKRRWEIEVPHLQSSTNGGILYLENAAVSTSGDTEQFVEIGGVRYSHIVNPRTGVGLTDRRIVTVIARRGVDADSLATALSVAGDKQISAAARAIILASATVEIYSQGVAVRLTGSWRKFAKVVR